MNSLILTLCGYILVVSVLRWSIVELQHCLTHNEIFKKNIRIGFFVSEIISILFLTHSIYDYKPSHLKHHNKKYTFTKSDEDFKFLIKLGFIPGMDIESLKKHFYISLVSPKFHFEMIKSRLFSRLGLFGSKTRKESVVGSVIWLTILIGFLIHFGVYSFTVVYLIPFILISNIAALAQFATEHAWGSKSNQSWGRFIGESLPNNNMLLFLWVLKLLFLWVPLRFVWLPGGLSSHDAHHLSGRNFDPFNPTFSRGFLEKDMKMSETWGFNEALERAMTGISNCEK